MYCFIMLFFCLSGIYAYVVLKDDIRQTEDQLAIALKAIVKRRVSSFAQPDVIVVRRAVSIRGS